MLIKLIKKPETQLEYWEIIVRLGHLSWKTDNPYLASDFIEKDSYSFDEDGVWSFCSLTDQMLKEIGQKFGFKIKEAVNLDTGSADYQVINNNGKLEQVSPAAYSLAFGIVRMSKK